MIPNITKGTRMQGLMQGRIAYLAGPGRANEHTDPHLVAGSPSIMAWHNDDELNASAAPIAQPGSVLPPKYERPRTPTTTRTGNDRPDIER